MRLLINCLRTIYPLSLLALLLISAEAKATDYDLWVANERVTSENMNAIASDQGGNSSISFDGDHTLTLNNVPFVSFQSPFIKTSMDLTIHLVGTSQPDTGESFIVRTDGDNSTHTVTFTTDPENPGKLLFQGGYSHEGFELVFENGLAWNPEGYYDEPGNASNGNPYAWVAQESLGLKVAGTVVTEGNVANVLGDNDATVSFDSETNTLTLNNATIEVYDQNFIESGLENLTVFLVGDNNITCTGIVFSKTSAIDEATITFTTSENSNGRLTVMTLQERLFGSGVTASYDYVSMKHDGDSHIIDSSCGISVGGVEVTEFNKSDVLGDATVSYNSTTHTLTLNNAAIAPEEENEAPGITYSNEEDLTIALIGNSWVQGLYGCPAISYYGVEPPKLSFSQVGVQHFSLDLITQVGTEAIDGFRTTDYGDFFVFGDEDDGTYTTTVSSFVFGGTGSEAEPFLIKTADDLVRFASYYNNGVFSRNAHVQLYSDINCEETEGFTTIANNTDVAFAGVFDGNSKTISNLTMTGMGLFGYVEKDGDDVGTIKDLTLSGCQLTLESGSQSIGGIAAELSNGAVISNCTVKNSTVACARDTYNPHVAGIAALVTGSTVTGCVADHVQVKAETTYSGGSGPEGSAGGIAAQVSGGTVSSCLVSNGTKVTLYYADEDASLYAGAILGHAYEATLSNNYYHDDVIVELLNGTDENNKIVRSGDTQRGTGDETLISDVPYYDVIEDNGAVMYQVTRYDIAVAGVRVTELNATDVLGDGKVSYDAEANTLTMDGVSYSPSDETPFVESGLEALTVKLMDSSSVYVSSSADVTPAAAFVSTLADAVLTFTTDDDTRLQLLNTNTVELASGFSSIAFTGYLYREQNMVKNLLAPRPGMDGEYLTVNRAGYEPDGTTFHYEIDYVDEELENATGTFDPTQTAAENNITLSAPCVVTVYAQYGTVRSAEKEGRYLGFAQSVLNVPIGTTEVEVPAIVPATGDDIEIGYEGVVPDEHNRIDLSEYTQIGDTQVLAYFSTAETLPYTLLNDNAQLTVNIVPLAPSASLEEGTYNDIQYVTLTPNLPEGTNGFIHYQRIVNGEVTTDSTYSVPLTISETTTLTFYQEAFNTEGQPFSSETVSVVYTILPKTELNISYAQNSHEWATYYSEGQSLETPAGLQAYVVTDIQEDGVSVSEISYIPQGVGVLLRRTESVAEPIMAKACMEEAPQPELPDNLLVGTAGSMAVSSLPVDVYVLYDDNFARATSGTIPACRCYLPVSAGGGGESRLAIRIADEPARVSLISHDRANGGTVCDLQGRRVKPEGLGSALKKGIYIVNGRKVMK